jgi:hypothetical protein
LCHCQPRSFLAFGFLSCGLDAHSFLSCGLLALRLQPRRRQSFGFLALGLQSCGLDARRFFPTSRLRFRSLNLRHLHPIRLSGKFSSSLANVLADSLPGCRFGDLRWRCVIGFASTHTRFRWVRTGNGVSHWLGLRLRLGRRYDRQGRTSKRRRGWRRGTTTGNRRLDRDLLRWFRNRLARRLRG